MTSASKADSALDNVGWHTLTGRRKHLGTVLEHAARFDPDVSPFSAISSPDDPKAWDDLTELCGRGGVAVLFGNADPIPDEWTVLTVMPCVQMVATDAVGKPDDRFIPLGDADVDEMLALTNETKPGPFGPRTHEFGGYIGLRENGKLVAMAGERMAIEGLTEISAVCTTAEHRGRGLATALVLALVHAIHERGEDAFLHALTTNENAIRLYETLGFTTRTVLDVKILRVPGAE